MWKIKLNYVVFVSSLISEKTIILEVMKMALYFH